MLLVFDRSALEDLRYWVDTDRKKALKIIDLIEAALKEPFEGIGKPEPLRHALAGCWSRRIDQEHRLVYRVEKNVFTVLACRYHYI
jgi:toxin YoeB